MNQFNLTEAECDSASRNLSEMMCSEKLAASPPELKQWTTSETLPCPDVVLWIEDGYFYQRQHDDYFHDQFYWKRNLQIKYHTVDYLAIQPHVTVAMRSKLITWLVQVNRQFEFDMETFLLSINFVDRFLATTPVDKNCLQLLGVAALLVAAKKEEVCPPEIDEIVRLCGKAYKARNIRQMEMELLCRLDFQLCPPTASYFFEYYISFNRDHIDIRLFRMKFHQLLEDMLTNYELCRYLPSTIAAAAICLTQKLLHPNSCNLPLPEIFTIGEQHDIKHCFVEMSIWHSLHDFRQTLYWHHSPLAPALLHSPESGILPVETVAALSDILMAQDCFTAVLCNQIAAISIIPHKHNI